MDLPHCMASVGLGARVSMGRLPPHHIVCWLSWSLIYNLNPCDTHGHLWHTLGMWKYWKNMVKIQYITANRDLWQWQMFLHISRTKQLLQSWNVSNLLPLIHFCDCFLRISTAKLLLLWRWTRNPAVWWQIFSVFNKKPIRTVFPTDLPFQFAKFFFKSDQVWAHISHSTPFVLIPPQPNQKHMHTFNHHGARVTTHYKQTNAHIFISAPLGLAGCGTNSHQYFCSLFFTCFKSHCDFVLKTYHQ